jgi:hypothetical protein
MPNHTRKRLRPDGKITPIHVAELLAGPGMRGFLSVLEPPPAVPHLQEAAGAGSSEEHTDPGERFSFWLAAQAEVLARQLTRQQDALLAIAEVACRLNGGAHKLHRQAVAVKRRVVRERLRRYFQERRWKP